MDPHDYLKPLLHTINKVNFLSFRNQLTCDLGYAFRWDGHLLVTSGMKLQTTTMLLVFSTS
jgi:hypothetical protein